MIKIDNQIKHLSPLTSETKKESKTLKQLKLHSTTDKIIFLRSQESTKSIVSRILFLRNRAVSLITSFLKGKNIYC